MQNNKELAGEDSLYAAACLDKNTNEVIVKLVNASDKPAIKQLNFDGKKIVSTGKLITLQSDDLRAMNSFENPTNVAPKEENINVNSKGTSLTLKPYSFTIVRVKMQ